LINIPLTTFTAQISEKEIQVLLKRLDDQDSKIRELEAAQAVLRKSKATIRYVDECVENINSIKAVEPNYNSIEKTQKHLQSELQAVNARIDSVMELVDREGHRHKEELQSAERRWQDKFQSTMQDPKERQDGREEYPAEKFYNDFKLMIRECFLSNLAGTPVNPAGIELQQPCGKAHEALKRAKLPKKEEAPVASTSKAPSKKYITDDDILSFEQKKELSESISKLEGSKLEKVMQIIREGVPEFRDVSPSEPFS
jgi:prefoldin subunit 5